MDDGYRKIVLDGLWNNNQALVALLGLCPLLAVSNTLINGLGLGLATTLVLIPQPVTAAVQRSLLLHAAYGADLIYGANLPDAALRGSAAFAAAVLRLVAFYIRGHNEKIPRAALGVRTPDEVYFGREEDLPERLSEQRKTAQRVRNAANRAASCYRCEPSRAGPGLRSVARPGARRKPARKSA